MKPGEWSDLVEGQRPVLRSAPRLVHFAGGEHGQRLKRDLDRHKHKALQAARAARGVGLLNYLNGADAGYETE